MSDFDLDRFRVAQSGVYDTALAEIRAGQKRSHWMWFVFPQVAGLGSSPTARHFAIGSLDEARAYLADPVLGGRYLAAVEALQGVTGKSAEQIFGGVDAMKLRSSLTLFEAAGVEMAGVGPMLGAALERWFVGERDARTLALLATGRGG
ncbi:DUF1810 domain-containing protein [Sphingomonas sp. TREG-RG-20F-R18-01]|uniref:DUF1810 domain-containing protein n=1 Tax=Sphingomonas sp. TREG-RG-20F-R18-01 TaxID=2914982 RepID=UPI001F588758|nr:DUF1810 domain-containing protein [Sphingomonas sp. TREG-RG-20F-R18-01]